MAENVYSELVEPILYYGDNLEILRRYIENESVDLVHLDPPYNTGNDQLKTNTALQMESAKIEFKVI
jgi:DNA modification methylase